MEKCSAVNYPLSWRIRSCFNWFRMEALFCISNHVSTPKANIKNELQFLSKRIDSESWLGLTFCYR